MGNWTGLDGEQRGLLLGVGVRSGRRVAKPPRSVSGEESLTAPLRQPDGRSTSLRPPSCPLTHPCRRLSHRLRIGRQSFAESPGGDPARNVLTRSGASRCSSLPGTASWRSRVVFGVGVEQPANHPLVLRVVLARFGLEEIDASFAQGDRHLHAFFTKYQILGRRQEIRNDF